MIDKSQPMLGTNPTNDDAATQITASLKPISMVVSFPAKNNAKPTAGASIDIHVIPYQYWAGKIIY